jgi:hypothetical protein
MTNWIDRYIGLIKATHKQIVLLHDRDGLLDYAELRQAVEQIGYSILRAETPWQVRIHYELRNPAGLHPLIIRIPADYRPLPDIVEETHLIFIGLLELFPLLDTSVLQGLSPLALTSISSVRQYEYLAREATVKWLLEHLYNIDVDSLKTTPDRDRVVQAYRKIDEHPAGSNSAIQSYMKLLAEPFQTEFDRLLNKLNDTHQVIATTPETWFERASLLGQAMRWAMAWPNNLLSAQLSSVITEMNDQFQSFLDIHYEQLFSLSAAKRPAVVSRVLDYLRVQPGKKTALIVLDGLNIWQGQLLAESLFSAGLHPVEGATMAYIPSITAWSRQALFKGKRPDLTTDNRREGKLFEQYWHEWAFQSNQVQYSTFSYAHPFDFTTLPNTTVRLGLVCNDLDDLIHSTKFGNEQLQQATQQWIRTGPILPLITQLKQRDFTCYITADHGNVEAVGLKNLKIAEKVGALSRSKRHIQFANTVLVSAFIDQNPHLSIGIRDRSVYLRDASAFTTEDQTVVTHGGSHIWEVIVPLIKV